MIPGGLARRNAATREGGDKAMTKTSSLLFMAGKYRRLAEVAHNNSARDQRLALARYFERKAARKSAASAIAAR